MCTIQLLSFVKVTETAAVAHWLKRLKPEVVVKYCPLNSVSILPVNLSNDLTPIFPVNDHAGI